MASDIHRGLTDLCRFIYESDLNTMPQNVVVRAKQVLIDTLGVILAGSQADPHGTVVDGIVKNFSPCADSAQGCTCPGYPKRFDPLNAALLNGIAGSGLEFEEGNSRAMGHPAIQIVPAVVAWAEASSVSGADTLMAIVCGYEAACRVSHSAAMRRGLHPTGTWGVIGAAMGVGKLGGKNTADLNQVANIAAAYTLSPFVKNSFVGQNVASTFAGLANYTGILANIFFDSGIRADSGSFEMTFEHILSQGFQPQALNVGLGNAYAISENYFKPYPTCRFTHPALDALKAILDNHTVDPKAVDRIRLTSFKAAVHVGAARPANVEAMRFSTPYLLAAMLIHGRVDLAILTEDLLQHPWVKALAAKVDLIHSSEYERLRPDRNLAHIELHFKDGHRLSHEITDCLGDPRNPLDEQTIHAKFESLAEPIIGPARAQTFIEQVAGLEQITEVRSLLDLLRFRNG